MAAKRTNLSVVEARLDTQDDALKELRAAHETAVANLRADSKEVLAAITATNLAVVQLPKWEDVRKLHEAAEVRIKSLEETRDQQKGGWKVIAVIGTASAAIGGWVSSLLQGKVHTP